MHIAEIETVWCRTVNSSKQRQKVLDNLDREISEIFFLGHTEAAVRIGYGAAQTIAADTDMHPVVGQTGSRVLGQYNQVPGNDSGVL